MKKSRNPWFLMVEAVVILCIVSVKCRKEEYDLFPLKVGNEYYYKHSVSFDDFVVGYDTIGVEKWTVLKDSKNNNDIEYTIEKKFNGIYVNWSSLQNDKHRDTIIITDKTEYFIVTEKPSGELLFWDFTIPRYSDKADITIHKEYYSQDYTKSYFFKADLGLTSYFKSFGLMSHRIRESLIQDSVRISR
jgi:hypothetical protein